MEHANAYGRPVQMSTYGLNLIYPDDYRNEDLFDDILGDGVAAKRRPGRPPGSKTRHRPAPAEANASLRTTDLHTVMGGVSIPWMVKVFRMGRGRIEEALRDCPVLRVHPNGGAIYDLPTAAAHLVAPVTNIEGHLRRLKPSDLPEHLKSAYWDAKTKEAKFRVMAGDLWPTAAILDVFGETFKTIKSTAMLWTDTIDESKGLTNEQRTLLTGLVDRLMGELHQALIEQSRHKMTASWLKEFEDGASEA